MDTNIYSNDLTDNLGDMLVHWIRKVREIKAYKTSESVRNEVSPDRRTGRIFIKIKSSERLERRANYQE